MAAVIRRFALALVLGAALGAAHAEDGADEPELRAAMVYNLLSFAEWPAGALPSAAEFDLCLVTDDHELLHAFARFADRALKRRRLALRPRRPLSELDGCDAVYFDRLDPGLLADKLATLQANPVLTLADEAQGRSGAMIGLGLYGRRLGFTVDAPRLRAAGLALPAAVLELAHTVYR